MTINELVKKEIYNKIDTSIKVSSSLIVGNDTHVNSCNFKWLELVKEVVIGGEKYKVKSSSIEGYSYVIVGYTGVLNDIKLKNFYFYEGTAIDVTQVFSQKTNFTWGKLPMMWLSFNPLPRITTENGTVNPYPRSIRLVIYLAGETDYANRHTEEHMQEVVAYLSEYSEAISKAIESNRAVFAQEFTCTEMQMPIFGRLGSDGFVENILDKTNMSAIEIELDVRTSIKCKC